MKQQYEEAIMEIVELEWEITTYVSGEGLNPNEQGTGNSGDINDYLGID